MRSIAGKKRRWKKKVTSRREMLKEMMTLKEIDDIDVKVSLIQALIPLGLEAVNEKLQKEVISLAGKKHIHGKENLRWGKQGGSVYLLDQKVPVTVPRVRNKLHNSEIPLAYYQKLQEPYQGDEQVFKKLLNGLSTHKYRESAELVPEVFGISASNLSRRFKYASYAKLKQLQQRRLDKYDFVAIFIDGKRFSDNGLMIALGITQEGKKIILGIEQTATENHRPLSRFFEKLIERGLRYEKGLLFIVDGSKGIAKAINEIFPRCAVIQRCHYHKIENVVSYLPKGMQGIWRAKLRAAYKHTKYEAAKTALAKLYDELYNINPSAASSLKEGLEETLTLHRLELYGELGKSFTSTNCIESVMSQLGQYTDKVDRWRGGNHIQRWAAAGLLALEPRLSKVRGFRHLKLLRMKLLEEVAKRQKKQPLEYSRSEELGVGIHLTTPEIQG
jgi:transposase-like protein